MIIGITGISGAGKSTVAKEICKIENGKYVNADKIAKDLAKNGEEYYKEIVKNFGIEILKEDAELDRKKLASIVFENKEKKKIIDDITNKYVVPKIEEEAKNADGYDIAIIDVPLLFESRLNEICDVVISVIASKETCIKRIMDRDKINEESALKRIKNQKSENFFKENSDYCIINETKEKLNIQINDILNKIR